MWEGLHLRCWWILLAVLGSLMTETPLEAARDAVKLKHARGCSWWRAMRGGEHGGCDCGAVDRLDAFIAEARSEATELRRHIKALTEVVLDEVGAQDKCTDCQFDDEGVCWAHEIVVSAARALTPADAPTEEASQ